MIILGVDPGIAIVGYGIIKNIKSQTSVLDYGVIETRKDMYVSERLNIIFDSINRLIQKWLVEIVSIESLFYFKNQKTIINVAQARGVIMLSGQRNDCRIYEYTPLQVKQSMVGYGRATKKQMQIMVQKTLGLTKIPKPDDAADGLALALCHSYVKGLNFK